MATWNAETLIGLGKHESLARFAQQHGPDIILLQETKSQSSDELRIAGVKSSWRARLLSQCREWGSISAHIFYRSVLKPISSSHVAYATSTHTLDFYLRPRPIARPTVGPNTQKGLLGADGSTRCTLTTPGSHILRRRLQCKNTFPGARSDDYSAVFPSPGDLENIEGSMIMENCLSSSFLRIIVLLSFGDKNSHIITYKEICAGAGADPKCPDNSCFACPLSSTF